jgi:hypothetical protein
MDKHADIPVPRIRDQIRASSVLLVRAQRVLAEAEQLIAQSKAAVAQSRKLRGKSVDWGTLLTCWPIS